MELPIAFCERMKESLGEEYPAFLASYDLPEVKGIRLNPRYGLTQERAEALLGVHLDPIPYEDTGYWVTGELTGNHPLHHAGAFYMQEPSAMLPANALDIPQDATVLDLCAAPGGKSTRLSQLVPDGLLVSNEIDLGRCRTLVGNLERLGAPNTVVTNLDPSGVERLFGGAFDVVLVDAPCSGEGMFRKNPQAKEEWSLSNVAMCAARQKDILSHAIGTVKAGGYLVYSTCTFAPDENEGAVAWLTEHGFELVEPTQRVMEATVPSPVYPLARRAYPHLTRGEGHFVAVLRKVAGESAPRKLSPWQKPDPKEDKLARAFVESALDRPIDYKWWNGYAVLPPKGDAIPPKGLNVGVKLGKVEGGRFVPHHALWRCMWKDCKISLDLPLDDPRVAKYLRGETIQADVPNGWGVLTVEGCPLGGFKAVDCTLKNHYPKGLRLT